MQFQLVTLAGTKLDEAVYEVILPTTEGVISVFPSHEALVTMAVPGIVSVRRRKEDSDDELEYFAISGGVVEINQERADFGRRSRAWRRYRRSREPGSAGARTENAKRSDRPSRTRQSASAGRPPPRPLARG